MSEEPGSPTSSANTSQDRPLAPLPPTLNINLNRTPSNDDVTRRLLGREVVDKTQVSPDEPWAGCNWREALHRLEQYLCIACGANQYDFAPLIDWNPGAFVYNQTAVRVDTHHHCREMLRVVQSAPTDGQGEGRERFPSPASRVSLSTHVLDSDRGSVDRRPPEATLKRIIPAGKKLPLVLDGSVRDPRERWSWFVYPRVPDGLRDTRHDVDGDSWHCAWRSAGRGPGPGPGSTSSSSGGTGGPARCSRGPPWAPPWKCSCRTTWTTSSCASGISPTCSCNASGAGRTATGTRRP